MLDCPPKLPEDAETLAERFARDGRLTISDFLPRQEAADLYSMLRKREDWRQVIIWGERIAELDRPTQKALTDEQRETLDRAVYENARTGFQARYETIRIPDDPDQRGAADDPLAQVAKYLSSERMVDFFRTITGRQEITFADAQATAYSPGDFLTGHDDAVAQKNRVAAYVLGLTPTWRMEWGGLLLFHEASNTRGSAIAPGFNQLNLFMVGQQHSVTEVTRAAASRRLSITGWLRA